MALSAAIAVAVAATTPTLAQSLAPTGDLPVPAVAGHQTVVSWGGVTWLADPGAFTDASGGGRTDAESAISVDAADRLHLRIVPTATGPAGPELTAAMTPGYGTYSWTIERPSISTLDPAAALGLFLYSSESTASPSTRKREIDIENSKWAVFGRRAPNAQYVVQPYWVPDHRVQFRVANAAGTLTEQFTWLPNQVIFTTYAGPVPTRRTVIDSFTFTGADVPTANPRTLLHMNLWIYSQTHYNPSAAHEVVLDAFHYTPAPGQPLIRRG